jgi:hypothetical protein
MINFKLNGKKIQVASSWDDLTYGQYLQIIKINDDLLKLVSICSGTDYDILKKSNIYGLESVIEAMSFVKSPPVFPESITEIAGYSIPKNFNIQFESLAQFEDMRSIMMAKGEDKNKVHEDFGMYVSLYLQKIRDKEYDFEKAKAMREEVLNMPALKVLALGGFFLLKLVSLSNGIKANSQATNQNQKKSKQVTKGSRQSSARSVQSSKRRSR